MSEATRRSSSFTWKNQVLSVVVSFDLGGRPKLFCGTCHPEKHPLVHPVVFRPPPVLETEFIGLGEGVDRPWRAGQGVREVPDPEGVWGLAD